MGRRVNEDETRARHDEIKREGKSNAGKTFCHRFDFEIACLEPADVPRDVTTRR